MDLLRRCAWRPVAVAAIAAAAAACGATGEPAEPGEPAAEALAGSSHPAWRLALSDDALAALETDLYADVEVKGEVEVAGARYAVGVELQGSTSRAAVKRSYKLKFRERPFEGTPFRAPEGGGAPRVEAFDKLILKGMPLDPTMMREALSFELAADLGLLAPRVGFADLVVNGAPVGLYAVVEPVDADFIARRKLRPGGALYKGVNKLADFDPGVDPRDGFEKKTLRDAPWTDLEALLDRLQHTPRTRAAFESTIDPVLSLKAYIDRMIWISATQNLDAVTQNYYLYHEPAGSDGPARWHVICWDADVSFGNFWSDAQPGYPAEARHMLRSDNFFAQRLVSIDAFRHALVDRFTELLEGPLSPARVHARAAALREDLGARAVGAEAIDAFIDARTAWLTSLLPAFRDDPLIDDPR